MTHSAHWCAGSDAEAQAAAPLLLQQCLEDILDDDATSVAQLAGLPLAPLADGRRGTLQLASQAGAAGDYRVEAIGPFPVFEHIPAFMTAWTGCQGAMRCMQERCIWPLRRMLLCWVSRKRICSSERAGLCSSG